MMKKIKIIIIVLLSIYIAILLIESTSRATYDPEKNYDYLVIPGSIMNEDGSPSLMMRQRIDTAEQVIEENPGITIVATGARGSDEVITEASAIKQELIKRGYNSTPIILEENAVSTATNIKYSEEFVKGNVAIVSQQFHMFRIKMLLKRYGLDWDVQKVESEYVLPLAPFYREPFAIVKSLLFDR